MITITSFNSIKLRLKSKAYKIFILEKFINNKNKTI